MKVQVYWRRFTEKNPARYGVNRPWGPKDLSNWLRCQDLMVPINVAVSQESLASVDLDVVRESIR